MHKRLIVGVVILGLVAFAALVYTYERHYRGPGESALFGTWADPDPMWDGSTFYYRLNPDHTFEFLSDLHDEESIFMKGRWHAGGDVVFFSLRWEDVSDRKLLLWRIDHISAAELRIRYNPRGGLHVYTRVALDSPRASNQAMERTATRSAFALAVAGAFSLPVTRVLSGRRSSCSR